MSKRLPIVRTWAGSTKESPPDWVSGHPHLWAIRAHEKFLPMATDATLKWLFDFAQTDLSSSESRVQAAEDLAGLMLVHMRTWAPASGVSGAALRIREDDVPALQSGLKKLLAGLAPGEVYQLPMPVVDAIGWRAQAGAYPVATSSPLARVLSVVLHLLQKAGADLSRCETCARLFVRGRSQQRFCSKVCGTRARVATWQKKHAARLGDIRHRQYVKQVKKRQPKARVVRRRRRS